MNWLQRYRIRLYLRNSIWLFPAISILPGIAAASLLIRVERSFGLEMDIRLDTARTIMGTVAASTFNLVVLVCSAVLVAVQLASGQLTPRIIGLVYRNTFRKIALAIFVFTFTFSVAVLARLENSVPLITGYLAAYGFLVNVALFLFFVDSIGKELRPSRVLRSVSLFGRSVVEKVYPETLRAETLPLPLRATDFDSEPNRTILNKIDGVLLAFDLQGLVLLAEQLDCVIELVPEVGDYVAAGDPIFRIYHGGKSLGEVDLLRSVALGPERTLEQDPMFAFRIMVDIASKTLSPAINDPTTAVLAIDQIHHLLRDVGRRHLAEGQEVDRLGRVRLLYRTPKWDDFIHLAITEIRHYGRDSIQVTRRLRAMLENLLESLPDLRLSLLRNELALLDAFAIRSFPDAYDQTLAEIGDLQGMGGTQDERHQHELRITARVAR